MIDQLLALLSNTDKTLFDWIHNDAANLVFDWVFPNITDLHKIIWVQIVGLVLLVYFFIRKFAIKGFLLFFYTALIVGAADSIASQILKPFFGRLRPVFMQLQLHERAPTFGSLSFPSNHATNVMCAALLLGYFFPKARKYLILWALLIGLSRIYVGAHFPGDVLAGFLFGGLMGTLGILLISRISSTASKKSAVQ
jgi:undecaprenyl-diphosphatase